MGAVERLSFEDATAPTLIAGEHRHRYRLAASLLEGRRVLDLCCGTGYGAAILADTARAVHGVDIDAAAVDAAAAAVPEATFEVGDAVAFLGGEDLAERFDAVVCFEGIEHVPDATALIARLRELAEGGMAMVLSVPNSAGLDEDNDFHVTDFGWERVKDDLGALPGATVLTQYLAEGSVICAAEPRPEGEPEARIELADRREPEYANHYVVLSGLDARPLDGLLQIEASPAANRYVRDLERANQELRRTNARLTRWHLGRADSAAASQLARDARQHVLDETFENMEAEHAAWVERCLGAEARERELAARLATQLEQAAQLDSLAMLGIAKVLRKVRSAGRRRA